MNVYFKKIDKKDKIILNSAFKVGDKLKLNYYDQFKYLHIIEGKCMKKRKTLNTYYVVIYEKTKNFYFSFFLNSPLILALFKK